MSFKELCQYFLTLLQTNVESRQSWNCCTAEPQFACEPQTYFRSSLLSLRKLTSANPSGKTISVTWSLLFWCWPIRSKDRNTARVTPCDLARWRVSDFSESYQIRFGTWISRLSQGFGRRKMLTSLWRSGFLSYVYWDSRPLVSLDKIR